MKLPSRATINVALTIGMILIILSIAASYLTINSLISGAQSETQARETMMLLEEVVSDSRRPSPRSGATCSPTLSRTSPPTSRPWR
jgi:CHASE3 domain sensor protein